MDTLLVVDEKEWTSVIPTEDSLEEKDYSGFVGEDFEEKISWSVYISSTEEKNKWISEATIFSSPHSLLEVFKSAAGRLSESDWDNIPSDLAENHDHYLYKK